MYKLDLHFPFLTVGSKAAPLTQVYRLVGASDNLFGSRCDDFLAPVWFSPGDLPRKSGFCCLQWRRSRPLFHTCARNTLNLRRRVPGWKGRSFSAYLSCHSRLAPESHVHGQKRHLLFTKRPQTPFHEHKTVFLLTRCDILDEGGVSFASKKGQFCPQVETEVFGCGQELYKPYATGNAVFGSPGRDGENEKRLTRKSMLTCGQPFVQSHGQLLRTRSSR